MHVRIKAYGAVAWAMGTRTAEADLPAGAIVNDLLAVLGSRYQGLLPFLPAPPAAVGDLLMVVIGMSEVSGDHPLTDGDEVLLVLPASGGAGTALEVK